MAKQINYKKLTTKDWGLILGKEKISENILRKYKDKFDIYCWLTICMHQNLSENFIREFADIHLPWYKISRRQKLSEAFIKEFQDKVDWVNICIAQTLSEKFIEDYRDVITRKQCWFYIYKYQKLSLKFKNKYIYLLINEIHDIINNLYNKVTEQFNTKFVNDINDIKEKSEKQVFIKSEFDIIKSVLNELIEDLIFTYFR